MRYYHPDSTTMPFSIQLLHIAWPFLIGVVSIIQYETFQHSSIIYSLCSVQLWLKLVCLKFPTVLRPIRNVFLHLGKRNGNISQGWLYSVYIVHLQFRRTKTFRLHRVLLTRIGVANLRLLISQSSNNFWPFRLSSFKLIQHVLFQVCARTANQTSVV